MIPHTIGLWSPTPGCGKSTVAQIICELTNARVLPFAGPLKLMLEPMLSAAGYSQAEIHYALYTAEGKHERLYRLPKMPTARDLMQTLGTEWGRFRIDHDLWTTLWSARARHSGGMRIVADDVRFPNEAAAVRAMGGQMWCITSDRVAPTADHYSEGQLGDHPFEIIIMNNGSIKDLRNIVTEMLK